MKTDTSSYLMENEKILWEGKAEPFRLLDAPYKYVLPVIWGVSAVIFLAFIGLYIPFFFKTGSTLGQLLMAVLCIVATPAFLSLEPFYIKKLIESQTAYVLTDKRALLIRKNEVKAVPIDETTPVRIQKLSNGCDVLFIGKDAFDSTLYASRKNTVYAFHNPAKDPGTYTGIIFYSIRDADNVCRQYAPFAV